MQDDRGHRLWEPAGAAAAQFRPFEGMVIAHRGRSGGAPENAIEGLASVPGYAAGVEVDVRLSRDGVPVLMHDSRVDRTTTGTGEVAELSYPQLAELRGEAGVRVPTLPAYLAACAGRGFRWILVDVKSATPAALAAVAAAVADSPVAGACVVMVRDEPELAQARKAGEGLRLGCFGVTVANVAQRLAGARQHRAELLLVAHGSNRYLANRAVIGPVRAAGFGAGASTINTGEALEAARLDGCDLLMTDHSDRLDHFLGQGC